MQTEGKTKLICTFLCIIPLTSCYLALLSLFERCKQAKRACLSLRTPCQVLAYTLPALWGSIPMTIPCPSCVHPVLAVVFRNQEETKREPRGNQEEIRRKPRGSVTKYSQRLQKWGVCLVVSNLLIIFAAQKNDFYE